MAKRQRRINPKEIVTELANTVHRLEDLELSASPTKAEQVMIKKLRAHVVALRTTLRKLER